MWSNLGFQKWQNSNCKTIKKTSRSFPTLEILHQVSPLAHFPTHLDRRLTDCQGYQELFGFQTYKQPVTKSKIGHVTKTQTTTPVLLWKAKTILNTEAKRVAFAQASWPNKVETYTMQKDLPLPRVKQYPNQYLLFSCQTKYSSPFPLDIFLLSKFNFFF